MSESKPEPRWDLDYKKGRQGELWIEAIRDSIANDSIEVKNDARFTETGNIYIEYGCKKRGTMQPSGIATTDSKLWIQILVEGELALIISTEKLREIARRLKDKYKRRLDRGSHPTIGVAIPVKDIIEAAITRRPRRSA